MRQLFGVLLIAATGVATPAIAADTRGAAEASNTLNDERIICRKMLEAGSLIRRTKQCFTRAEWDRLAEAHQRGVKRVQDELTTK